MKTITQLSLSIVLGLTLALSTAFGAKTNAVKAELKKPPSFLFVLQAKEGKLTPIKGKRNHFTLTLKHTDVNNVIEFSDRPFRMVKYISATDLKKLWPLGKNSLKADPPNAVLSAQGHNAQIVVLHGITVKNNTVSFHINLTNTQNTWLERLRMGVHVEKYIAGHRQVWEDYAMRYPSLVSLVTRRPPQLPVIHKTFCGFQLGMYLGPPVPMSASSIRSN